MSDSTGASHLWGCLTGHLPGCRNAAAHVQPANTAPQLQGHARSTTGLSPGTPIKISNLSRACLHLNGPTCSKSLGMQPIAMLASSHAVEYYNACSCQVDPYVLLCEHHPRTYLGSSQVFMMKTHSGNTTTPLATAASSVSLILAICAKIQEWQSDASRKDGRSD
jgi:hypothetical protein